jgi:hypothetical protein
MPRPTDHLQGTFDLLILRTLALELMHGWGISQRMQPSALKRKKHLKAEIQSWDRLAGAVALVLEQG